MDFDYKKYSLERLEEWIYDAISSAEASPQEIYDVIKRVVEEQYYHHKYHTGRCYDLLALLIACSIIIWISLLVNPFNHFQSGSCGSQSIV